MTFLDHLRRREARHVSLAVGPLPFGVKAPGVSEPSVPTPPVCGALDRITGAVCTLPPHPDRVHRDENDPAIQWWDDNWTTRRPGDPYRKGTR